MAQDFIRSDLMEYNAIRFFLKDLTDLTILRYVGIEDDSICGQIAEKLEKAVARIDLPLIQFANKWFENRHQIAQQYGLHTGNHWSPLINDVQIPLDADEQFAPARGFGFVSLHNKMLMQDEGRDMNICTGTPKTIESSRSGYEQFVSIRNADGKRLSAIPFIYGDGHSKVDMAINIPNLTHLRFMKIVTAGNRNNLNPPAGVLEAIDWLSQEISSMRIPVIWERTPETILSRTESTSLANSALQMFAQEEALKVNGQSIIPAELQGLDIGEFLNKSGLRAELADMLYSKGFDNIAREIERLAARSERGK